VPILCRDYDLLFSHVPKNGGTFVERVLFQHLDGERVGRKHHSYRRVESKLDPVPSIRVFTMREPLSWYKSYWAHARAVTKRGSAWPIWEAGDPDHPTNPIDRTGGAPNFERFIRKVLKNFPNGFVRSMYCNFLNGSTHVLRTSYLTDDLEKLLELVGYANPSIVRDWPVANAGVKAFKEQAVLPPRLEARITEVDNLDGLTFPYVADM
jgi:hypothetical protein